ncbi:MAG: sialic acid TRAP transporter substrate-binding protein SiaP [Lachnospirales bacterium]
MKKYLAMFLTASLGLTMLTGCGSDSATTSEPETQEPSETTETDDSADTTETAETEGEDLGEPVTLTISTAAVSTDTHAQAAKVLKDTVEELSEGNISVELYTDAQLFAQEEETAAAVAGDADIILSSASWLTTNSPWVSMFTAGYMFKSYDHMTGVLNGEIGDQVFSQIAEEQGILPLGAWYLGSRQISLSEDRAIMTPEDLNGVNLRMPNSEAWIFLGQALGANPTPISFSELYLSLQTGVVDGQDNPLPTVESAKFYEVQDSITLTNHLVDSIWPTINVETWNGLTDAQKEIVEEGVEAGRAFCDETNLGKEAELVEFFKEQGLSIYEADIDAFSEHVLNEYLNDSISDTWDAEVYEQVVAAGK